MLKRSLFRLIGILELRPYHSESNDIHQREIDGDGRARTGRVKLHRHGRAGSSLSPAPVSLRLCADTHNNLAARLISVARPVLELIVGGLRVFPTSKIANGKVLLRFGFTLRLHLDAGRAGVP